MLSAPAVLVVDAVTYLVAAGLVLLFVPRGKPIATAEDERGVTRGLRFLVREPLMRIWIPVFALGDAAWAAFFITVPVLVVARFDSDPRVAGWLLASFGVGAVLGNVGAYRLLGRFDGLSVIAVFVMGQALPLWLLTMELPAVVYSGALLVSGLANGLVNPSIHTLMTLRIPAPLRPTVMTSMMVVFVVAQPLGVFGAGPILDAFGVQPVLVAFATVQTVTMALISLTALRAQPRAVPAGAST